MASTTSKPNTKTYPWDKYRHEASRPGQGQLRWQLLIPGWAGHLDPDELLFIMERLEQDPDLRKWWGQKPSWRRVPEEAVLRVALNGDEADQSHNRRLAQARRKTPAAA